MTKGRDERLGPETAKKKYFNVRKGFMKGFEKAAECLYVE